MARLIGRLLDLYGAWLLVRLVVENRWRWRCPLCGRLRWRHRVTS